MATFKDINTSRLWRSFINIGECLRQLLYLFDVEGSGDPANETCEYQVFGSGILYKASIGCGLGNLAKATWLALGSLLYEFLRMLQTVLTAFASPSYAVNIRIPTFNDALNDVEVMACEVGAIIGGIFPVKFNCSSQVWLLLLHLRMGLVQGAECRRHRRVEGCSVASNTASPPPEYETPGPGDLIPAQGATRCRELA